MSGFVVTLPFEQVLSEVVMQKVLEGLTMNLCKSGQPLNTPLADRGKQLFR